MSHSFCDSIASSDNLAQYFRNLSGFHDIYSNLLKLRRRNSHNFDSKTSTLFGHRMNLVIKWNSLRLRLKMHFGRMETSLLNTSPVFWMKLVINLVWSSNTGYISKINLNQIFSSWSHFRCEKRRLNHATPIQLATTAIWTTRKWWRQRLTIIIPDIKRNKRLLHTIAPHKRFANRIYSPW